MVNGRGRGRYRRRGCYVLGILDGENLTVAVTEDGVVARRLLLPLAILPLLSRRWSS